jgi:predicted nucleic acid-binding protein
MKGANCLTDSLYFDTDCLSAFLWTKEENILTQLYAGKITIPTQVYNELSVPQITHLKKRIDAMIDSGDAVLRPILTGSDEYKTYTKLTNTPSKGHTVIGKGEAAAITLASMSNGIVASNNLKDVAPYIIEMNLRHITTGDILVKAYEQSFITEADGNRIWGEMLSKRRRIGAASFTEYLHMRHS